MAKTPKEKHERRKNEGAIEVVRICPQHASSVGFLAVLLPCDVAPPAWKFVRIVFFQPFVSQHLDHPPLSYLKSPCPHLSCGSCCSLQMDAPKSLWDTNYRTLHHLLWNFLSLLNFSYVNEAFLPIVSKLMYLNNLIMFIPPTPAHTHTSLSSRVWWSWHSYTPFSYFEA